MSRQKILNDAQIRAVSESFDELGATALAKNYGVSRQTIYRAVESFAKDDKPSAATSSKVPPYSEFGVTGLNRFGGSVREDYNRTWQNLLTMVPLVKEMLDHPIVGATMFAVEMYIRTAEWSVVPSGDGAQDEAARKFLEECMGDMSHTFAEHITQALSMLSYGFAPFEICYKKRQGDEGTHLSQYDDGRIGWRKFAFRSQDTLSPGHEWEFDKNGGIKGMYQKHQWDKPEVFIPIEKMILYRTTAAKNNPQGRSALRAAYMAWYYAKNFAEIEGISAERMGGGLPVIYLGEGTSKAGTRSDFDFAKSVVRDVRSDEQAGIVFPYQKQGQDGRGVLFELVSPPAKGVVDFNRAIMRYNQQISQTLLAQFIFLGLTEYGTQSLAVELTDLFADAMSGWLTVVTDVLNRYIVPRLFKFNTFNVEILPKVTASPTQDADVEKVLNAITLAVGAGVLLPDEGVERHVRGMLEFPQRGDPDAGQILSELPEYKKVVQDKIKNAQQAAAGGGFGGGGGGKLKDEKKLAAGKVRKHKLIRTPDQKVQQRAGSQKMSADVSTEEEEMGKEDRRRIAENISTFDMTRPDALEDLMVIAQEAMTELYAMEPVEVHIHNKIDVPDNPTPQVNIAPPEVQVDVAAPNVKVDNKFDVPKNPVNVRLNATLQTPDEVIETETIVDRGNDNFIKRILKRSRKESK
jgi:DNA-binding phage protein